MHLVSRAAVLVVIAAFCAGCGGHGGSVPTNAPTAAVLSGFKIPASLSLAVPPNPPNFIPAKPSTVRRTRTVHASFFAGEAALSNGVYYLALPNGTPFGYYSYLPDSNYIYHFDAGYEYVFDANDGKGGVYFYDFASGDWWYTGRQYPFPYIYDFGRKAFLYYYPDTSNAGHYTTNPRYFYNFTAGKIIALPDPNAGTIVEFTIPSASSFPFGITTGPDGALWFAENNGNKIGRVTTSGAFTEYTLPTANSGPWGITTGPDGGIWFTEYNTGKIGRITTP